MSIGGLGRVMGRSGGRDAAEAAEGGESAGPGRLNAVIDRGTQFDGKIKVEGTIRIDGELRGTVTSAESVIVGETAGVEAGISARSVIISGAVVGDVVASRQLVLRPTGRLHGNVETPCLIVEKGALFNGASQMFRPETAARTQPSEAEAKDARTGRPRAYSQGGASAPLRAPVAGA